MSEPIFIDDLEEPYLVVIALQHAPAVFYLKPGFLALNDIESSNTIWRPLLGLPSDPTKGLVSLKGFLRFMGSFMLVTTMVVALFKREIKPPSNDNNDKGNNIVTPENLKYEIL